jgi:hypothetical protein
MGSTDFQMKTLKHVSTEMALHVLAYNIKRVVRLLGVGGLIEATHLRQAAWANLSALPNHKTPHFYTAWTRTDIASTVVSLPSRSSVLNFAETLPPPAVGGNYNRTVG